VSRSFERRICFGRPFLVLALGRNFRGASAPFADSPLPLGRSIGGTGSRISGDGAREPETPPGGSLRRAAGGALAPAIASGSSARTTGAGGGTGATGGPGDSWSTRSFSPGGNDAGCDHCPECRLSSRRIEFIPCGTALRRGLGRFDNQLFAPWHLRLRITVACANTNLARRGRLVRVFCVQVAPAAADVSVAQGPSLDVSL
jgi:hypothetical protein